MSADLKNCGTLRIDELTDSVVEAIAQSTGAERSEIIRKVLHDWALAEVRKASLINKLSRGKWVGSENQ